MLISQLLRIDVIMLLCYNIAMSVRESYREQKEFLKEALGPYMAPMIKAAILFQSGNILEVLSESTLKRQSLPEPFDVAAHVGNFREGAMATVAAFGMIGIAAFVEKPREVFKRNARRAAVAAFAVSSAVQVVGEKFELTNSALAPNTGDPLDAAYGIGWSAVVAVGAYKLMTQTEQAFHDRALAEADARAANEADYLYAPLDEGEF